MKFVSIVNSNLDEFFMVRVAALKQKLSAGRADLSIDGRTVMQQLAAVLRAHGRADESDLRMLSEATETGAFARHSIEITDYTDLDHRERTSVDQYYRDTIFPVLTPLAFDPGGPSPIYRI